MSDNPDPTVPLEEWCADLSRSDRRVELIAVFAFRERAAGRFHDTAAAYAARYAETGAAPVL